MAGLLEGEGSFWMITNRVGGKPYRYPYITVNMTDQDVVSRVAALFKTSVYTLPPRTDRKQAWRASVQGARAAELMAAIRPWMGGRRRAKIDEVLGEYGEREPTSVKRRRSCSEAAASRSRDGVSGRFVAT